MEQETVMLISVEEIHILNPRVRNQVIAEEIRQNIRTVGLKRPITVTPRKDQKNGKKYENHACQPAFATGSQIRFTVCSFGCFAFCIDRGLACRGRYGVCFGVFEREGRARRNFLRRRLRSPHQPRGRDRFTKNLK